MQYAGPFFRNGAIKVLAGRFSHYVRRLGSTLAVICAAIPAVLAWLWRRAGAGAKFAGSAAQPGTPDPDPKTMTKETTPIPAYIDEAGARGRVRELTPARDHEFGLMCALVFAPDTHAETIQLFTPGFERFRAAKPADAKLHITDAFKPGNEAWAEVAKEVRSEFVGLIKRKRPVIVYAARRLALSRIWHDTTDSAKATAKASRRSKIKITGADRPSDWRIEDDLITMLALRLDAFGEMTEQAHKAPEVNLLFDETDKEVAERYEAAMARTANISARIEHVAGWDPSTSKRVQGTIAMQVKDTPFRIDTQYLGGIYVIGKEHPLVLAADIVTNYLAHHLGQLGTDAPLNAPSSIAGWELAERVWGVSDDASDDLY